jgi:sulfane dehydrogenase subunit SoxC
MTSRDDSVPGPLRRDAVSRGRFLTAVSAGIAGTAVTRRGAADTLADVPPHEVGDDLSGHSERSKYVELSRIPEAGPRSAQRRSE